jgi:pimeloyl-ACP methyl ester carboxylesterase
MTLPSLLLVPGAWYQPDHYRLLVDELSEVDVHVVSLTSSGDDPSTLTDMHADAEIIAKAAAAIDGPVVALAHSYGGVPTTQGLADASNVRHIVYLAAYVLGVGDSLLGADGGRLLPGVNLHQRDGVGDYVEATAGGSPFYNDLDPATAQDAVGRLVYQSAASFRQELTKTAWTTIPSTYIICDADNVIPVATQEAMATRTGGVLRMNASHSPFLSQPAELARLVRQSLVAGDSTP